MLELTKRQVVLLAKALSRGDKVGDRVYKNAYLKIEDAIKLYSSPTKARGSVEAMIMMGYLRYSGTPGIFRMVQEKIPYECVEYAENLRKNTETDSKS